MYEMHILGHVPKHTLYLTGVGEKRIKEIDLPKYTISCNWKHLEGCVEIRQYL